MGWKINMYRYGIEESGAACMVKECDAMTME